MNRRSSDSSVNSGALLYLNGSDPNFCLPVTAALSKKADPDVIRINCWSLYWNFSPYGIRFKENGKNTTILGKLTVEAYHNICSRSMDVY